MAASMLRRVSVCASRFSLGSLRIQAGFLHGNTGNEFRSAHSLEKIYPNSSFNYGSRAGGGEQQTDSDIPIERLTITYCRSSGPGGQNVNKVNTKAEVRFHIQTADWIPEDVRQKIISQHTNRINRSGKLIVTSEVSRYQMRNLSDCLHKIRDMIAAASVKHKQPSQEDVAFRRYRIDKMNRERLQQKKMHSAVKQSRRVEFD
ncbi:peptidyl-tRNA hydrolase ICT1, mitochondrial-like [Acipenser oxyrinchus oxyrinchus]|uniref:Large ribosomal subunit protein mL62 n=1 Tax=Acipenser oxyrinchus oxyrinchus TaxID=40147 RepID=A0AAD8D598_ACIOX|nr:peptidyl-tRNA hydrolase ICT1, mitochondrial-like [Acipenser oxyrinchus oxyrinchus]